MIHSLVEDLSLTAADPGQLLSESQSGAVQGVQNGRHDHVRDRAVPGGGCGHRQARLRPRRPSAPAPSQTAGRTVDVLGRANGEKKGPALGLFRDSKYPTCERSIETEDLLVFYTDGLVEEEDPVGDIFSEERLAETIAKLGTLPPKELLAKVLDELRRFSGHADFSDDVCLLGVEVKTLKTAVGQPVQPQRMEDGG